MEWVKSYSMVGMALQAGWDVLWWRNTTENEFWWTKREGGSGPGDKLEEQKHGLVWGDGMTRLFHPVM
jgi:hypothetical protein